MMRGSASGIGGGLLLALGLCLGSASAAPVVVSGGVEIDTYPSLLLRSTGDYLVALTRTTYRSGQISNRDVLVSRSTDQGRTWSTPSPVLSDRNFFEGPAELVELPNGNLLMFATTNRTGIDRILLVSSPDGINWTPAATPCEFGWGNTVNQRNAHAVVGLDGNLYLAYEAVENDAIYVAQSDTGGVLWDTLLTHVVSGARMPKLVAATAGAFVVTFEDSLPNPRSWVTFSGADWKAWGSPILSLDNGADHRAPWLVPFWDGSMVLYGSVQTSGSSTGHDLLRRFSPEGIRWTDSPENVVSTSADEGNPHVVFPTPGTVCLAWDRTTENGTQLTSGDILFEVISDTRCTTPPTFAGGSKVVDSDPCFATGVDLLWNPATAWGSGSSGAYTVYRSENPGFVAGPLNERMPGLTGTSWHDGSVLEGIPYFYLVRAENDEICGTAHSGLQDGNEVRLQGIDEALPAPDGPIEDLRLTWDVATEKAGFAWTIPNRAVSATLRRTEVINASPVWTTVVTAHAGNNYQSLEPRDPVLYYTAVGVNDCGVEGP